MKLFWLFLLSVPAVAQTKIPKHAHPVDKLWGWECNRGYIQQRDKCVKVKLPRHGVLNEDGHTWSCKAGYHKYRDVCLKNKKRR